MLAIKDTTLDATRPTIAAIRARTQPARSVLVLGAGVVGMASAYALARRGYSVTIVDSGDAPGRGASFANGAQLSYTYTDALASPSLLRHAPDVLLGLNPSLRMMRRFDPAYISWLLQLLRNTTPDRFEANTLDGLRLGLESRLAMHALLEQHPLDFAHAVAGKLHIYDSVQGFDAARRLVELKRRHGAEQNTLTPIEAVRLEPAIAARAGEIVGAVHSPHDEVGDPSRFCIALMSVLVGEYGANARLNTTVDRIGASATSAWISTDKGERLEADQLVVCAGIGSRRFLRRLGLGAALQPMKGYSFTAPRGTSPPAMSITDVSRRLVFCPLGASIRVAGLAELGAASVAVDPDSIGRLKDAAAAALPGAADYDRSDHHWAGIRPMTANSRPRTLRVSRRIAVNTGHGMLGWTYAMGSAERLAAELLEPGQ